MKRLSVIIALIFITVFLGSCTLSIPQSKNAAITNEAVFVKKISVYQRVTTDETNPPEYLKYDLDDQKTALDLLRKHPGVTMKGEGINAYVVGINGIMASEKNKEFWAMNVNSKMAEVGAGSYLLKDGDKIEWKIQKY